MDAVNFPEANASHGPPQGLDESHVRTIPSFMGIIEGGPHDGSKLVIVAWKPSQDDLNRLNAGGCVFLTMMGGLTIHFLSTDFKEAASL